MKNISIQISLLILGVAILVNALPYLFPVEEPLYDYDSYGYINPTQEPTSAQSVFEARMQRLFKSDIQPQMLITGKSTAIYSINTLELTRITGIRAENIAMFATFPTKLNMDMILAHAKNNPNLQYLLLEIPIFATQKGWKTINPSDELEAYGHIIYGNDIYPPPSTSDILLQKHKNWFKHLIKPTDYSPRDKHTHAETLQILNKNAGFYMRTKYSKSRVLPTEYDTLKVTPHLDELIDTSLQLTQQLDLHLFISLSPVPENSANLNADPLLTHLKEIARTHPEVTLIGADKLPTYPTEQFESTSHIYPEHATQHTQFLAREINKYLKKQSSEHN